MEQSTSITGFSSHALARTPMRFFVSTLDARADVHVTIVGGARLGGSCRAVADDMGDGRHCVRWEASASGTYTISVSVNGTVVHGCPLTCTVAEPLPLPKCTAYGDGLLRATAGARAHFHVELAEGWSASEWGLAGGVSHSSDSLSCALVRGGVRLAGTVVRLSASRFRVDYVAARAGEYRLELYVGGSRVEAGAGENSVRVEAGPVDGASSVVRWRSAPPESRAGVAVARAAEPLSFELHLFDACGNAAAGGRADGERLSVGVEGVDRPAPDWHIETSAGDVDGAFALCALPATSGEYRIHVAHGGLALRGSPVHVLVLPARARLSDLMAEGPGARRAVAGAPGGFALRHVGLDGEPADLSELGELRAALAPRRRAAADALGASHAHGACATVRARRAVRGLCVTAFEVTYATRAAGEHALAVTTASGEHVPGSPFALAVAPAQADAPSCELLAGTPARVLAGSGWELLVRARDRFGNAWAVGGERGFAARLLAQPSGGEAAAAAAAVVVLSTVDLHDGRYAFWLPAAPPVRAGVYRAEVSLRGALVGCVELCVLAAPARAPASPRVASAQLSASRPHAAARSRLDAPTSPGRARAAPRARGDDGESRGGAARARAASASRAGAARNSFRPAAGAHSAHARADAHVVADARGVPAPAQRFLAASASSRSLWIRRGAAGELVAHVMEPTPSNAPMHSTVHIGGAAPLSVLVMQF